jgi:4-azaleucine resistance transporter AzlC
MVLGAAVGVFGATFGVLASESGLSTAKACAMSLLVFTGASQFASVSIIGAGGSVVTAVTSALLLAARNGVYGLALAPRLRSRGLRRALGAQLVIDESTAMAVTQDDDRAAEGAFWATGVSVFVAWNLGTLFGAIAGNAIGDPQALGLDAAFPAGFVALIVPQLHEPGRRLAALLGAGVAAVAIPLTRPGVPVLLAAPAALVALAVLARSTRTPRAP